MKAEKFSMHYPHETDADITARFIEKHGYEPERIFIKQGYKYAGPIRQEDDLMAGETVTVGSFDDL